MNKTLVYSAMAGVVALIGDWVFRGEAQIFLRSLTFSIFAIAFLWGFKILGDKTYNNLLRNTSLANIIYLIVFTINLSPPFRKFISSPVLTLYIIIPGVIAIFSGIALLELSKVMDYLAKVTGALAILTGICIVTIKLNSLGAEISRLENVLSVAILFKAAGMEEFL